MKSLFSLTTIYFILNGVCFTQNIDYDSLIKQVSGLEEQGKTEDARIFLDNLLDQYPEYWFKTSKKLIRLNASTGKYDENLSIFREAHTKGLFYFIHPRMPVYKPYNDIPGFDMISARDLELRDSAVNASSTNYKVVLPDGYNEEEAWPVFFIFHGGGRTMNDAISHWQAPSLNKNYIKVYLQSYRHFDSETYGWGTGDQRLDKELGEIYAKINDKYNINNKMVLGGGISAGATAAIDVGLRGVIPFSGLMAWCPDLPLFIRRKNYSELNNKDLKIYISAGENDYLKPRQEILIKKLDSLEVSFKYELLEEHGHDYPPNEASAINTALKYLLDREILVDKDYEDIILQAITDNKCRGLSVAIGDPSSIFFYNYGKAFSNGNEAPNSQLIFEIGSVSKLFTTYIYAVLIEENIIKPYDRVEKHIPSLKNTSAGKIKLHELSEHLSGLPAMPDNISFDDEGNPAGQYSEEDLMEYLRRYKIEKSSPPFRYTNTGTALLALVLEYSTGKRYMTLLNEYIISEFGLNNTFLVVPDNKISQFADGSKPGKTIPHWDIYEAMAPSGGLRSTTEDLAVFMSSILKNKKYIKTRRFMQKIKYRDKINNIGVATGWFRSSEKRETGYWISGSTGGFSSFIGYNPDSRKFAVILSNSNISLVEAGKKIIMKNTP